MRKVLTLSVLALLASAGLPAKVAAAVGPAATTEEESALAVQEARYRCLIAAYLAEIRQSPAVDEDDRYLILSPTTEPGRYVQCLFHDHKARLYCEAASGFYDEGTARFVTPGKIAEIAALGYTTDASKGNFSQDRAAPDAHAFYQVAGLLLKTLVKVFELKADDKLVFNAPLVTGSPALEKGGEYCRDDLISLLSGAGRPHTWFSGTPVASAM